MGGQRECVLHRASNDVPQTPRFTQGRTPGVEHGVIPETMVSAYDNRSHTPVFQQPEKYWEKKKRKLDRTKENGVGRYLGKGLGTT